MSKDNLAKLRNLFLNLATDEVFPNFYRNHDLVYFEADRQRAAQGIDAVLAGQKTVDIKEIPYVRAAKEVAQRLRSFDQASYAKKPDFLKKQGFQEMVDFYAERFGLILDGTDFIGKPMDVKKYISELSQRRYDLHDGVSVPNSLNVTE